MIELIIIISALTAFTEALLDKWGGFEYLDQIGYKSPVKLLYDLSECRFCILFWIGVLISLVASLISGPEIKHLVLPFVVSGILKLLRG